MHGVAIGPTREEVHASAGQLPGARPSEDELQLPLLDEAMNLVEELRKSLNLVHHHPRSPRHRRELGGEPTDVGQEALVETLVE